VDTCDKQIAIAVSEDVKIIWIFLKAVTLRLGRDGMSSDDEPSGALDTYPVRLPLWRNERFTPWLDKIDEVTLEQRTSRRGSDPRTRVREGGQPSRRAPCENLPTTFYSKLLSKKELQKLTSCEEQFDLMKFSLAGM
jgi:hypothetical protein